MTVYRICLEKWTHQLTASGFPARWNSKGTFVVYTAGSRALACLENVVHRSGEGLNNDFRTMVINIPDTLKIAEISHENLPKNWTDIKAYSDCQKIGDAWIRERKTAVLRVPSSIIQNEYNYLLNPNHPDFYEIKLTQIEPFVFDSRIKGNL